MTELSPQARGATKRIRQLSIGARYGRLTITDGPILRRRADGRNKSWYRCRCDCGVEKEIASERLVSGVTVSCGCRQREAARGILTTHGDTGTRLHRIWKAMHARTRSQGRHAAWYANVEVCPQWHDYLNFKQWALASGYQDDLTIDRINPAGWYDPVNCRWIPLADNARRGSANTKRTARGVFTR